MPDFSHQPTTLAEIAEVRKQCRAICVTSPTASGKTKMMVDLASLEVQSGGRVVIYTNRKILAQQTSDALIAQGIEHGRRQAGHEPQLLQSVQVSSIDTERYRSLGENARWDIHDATLVIVDEAHSAKAETATKLIKSHLDDGATVTGWTATPVEVGHLYDELIVSATNSQLRKQGVLVPCDVFAPSEIDLEGIKRNATGEFVGKDVRERWGQVVQQDGVIGDIIREFVKLNPLMKPSVAFAPSVAQSRWLCERFNSQGIKSVHIDADTPDDERTMAFDAVSSGRVKVLCNYGVLREGWNHPATEVCLLMQPCGALSTFIQIVGRVLRAHPGKRRATLIDFVGTWYRHGSPNEDREWSLVSDDKDFAKDRKQKFEEGEEKEPICCSKCGQIIAPGRKCPCGHEPKQSVRAIRQKDGTLVKKRGNVTKRKQPKDDTSFWRQAIFAGANSQKQLTCKQLFYIANSMKREAGQPGKIELRNVTINVPEYGSPDWHLPIKEYYSWAVRK